jgi:2'-5' RNA ligase
MKVRSFLAFELPVEIKDIVSRVSNEMRRSPLDVRWIKVDNIHLTVIFIGNISADRLEDMAAAVKKVCHAYGPFNISLKSAGVFSSIRNPRVLWIGLNGDLERMSYFRDALQEQLKLFGVKEEKRRFNPHLTLGRFRKCVRSSAHLDEVLSRYKDLTSPVCALHELVLFKSDLKPSGAVYTNLDSWPLVVGD